MNNKRRLGKTDIIVSEIGLGGFQLGEKIIINNEANCVVHDGYKWMSVGCQAGDYSEYSTSVVWKNLQEEKDFGVDNFKTYKIFAKRVKKSKKDLKNLLLKIKKDNKKVVSIGATSKSTTVFNYCDIGSDLIECITDTTPDKIGLYAPGSHIPVVDRESIKLRDYDYAFLGAWNFRPVIVNKELQFLRNGGKFITHVPEVMVYQ